MKEPSTKLIGEVFAALKRLCRREICEIRVVPESDGYTVLTTERQKVKNIET